MQGLSWGHATSCYKFSQLLCAACIEKNTQCGDRRASEQKRPLLLNEWPFRCLRTQALALLWISQREELYAHTKWKQIRWVTLWITLVDDDLYFHKNVVPFSMLENYQKAILKKVLRETTLLFTFLQIWVWVSWLERINYIFVNE